MLKIFDNLKKEIVAEYNRTDYWAQIQYERFSHCGMTMQFPEFINVYERKDYILIKTYPIPKYSLIET